MKPPAKREKEFKYMFTLWAGERDGKPALEIRRLIKDEKQIRNIVKQALDNGKITINAEFKDRFKAVLKLREMGLLD